jgi:hypothetical protein
MAKPSPAGERLSVTVGYEASVAPELIRCTATTAPSV